MGLFSRRKDPDRLLAEAIAKRGVRARATIDEIAPQGDRHLVTVSFRTEAGENVRASILQALAPHILVGLEAGEPVDVSYDSDDPATAMIWGSPKFTVTEAGAVVRKVDLDGGERG